MSYRELTNLSIISFSGGVGSTAFWLLQNTSLRSRTVRDVTVLLPSTSGFNHGFFIFMFATHIYVCVPKQAGSCRRTHRDDDTISVVEQALTCMSCENLEAMTRAPRGQLLKPELRSRTVPIRSEPMGAAYAAHMRATEQTAMWMCATGSAKDPKVERFLTSATRRCVSSTKTCPHSCESP